MGSAGGIESGGTVSTATAVHVSRAWRRASGGLVDPCAEPRERVVLSDQDCYLLECLRKSLASGHTLTDGR